MRTFFLFYLLTSLLRSPLLALLIVLAVFYFAEARYSGRYFNPSAAFGKRRTIRELERQLSMNPHDVAARNDLGRILVEDGKFDEGREHLALAIKRMAESAETNYFLGIALLRTGDESGGLEHIGTALEINARFLYGDPQRVLARHYLDKGDLERAAEFAAESVKINTSGVEAWDILGDAKLRRQDRAGAREAFGSALQAYDGLPRYLKPGGRKWRAEARRSLKKLGS